MEFESCLPSTLLAKQTSVKLVEIGIGITKLFAQLQNANRGGKSVMTEQSPTLAITAEADRFELWAINMGLFVSGHGSLDYRLREAESLESTLRHFMSDLKESLSEALELLSDVSHQSVDVTHYKPSSEVDEAFSEHYLESEVSDSDSEMELLLDSVKDPIDRLYKLSSKIRNPSSRFISSRALQFRQTDPETGVDYLQAVARYDYEHVNSIFLEFRKQKAREGFDFDHSQENNDGDDLVSTSEPTDRPSEHRDNLLDDKDVNLVKRITRSIVRRRQQFAYWKHHRDKLAQHMETFERHDSDLKQKQLTKPALDADQTHITTLLTASKPALAPSVTTASRLVIPQQTEIENKSAISISEYAASTWRPDAEIIGFPSAPKRAGGQKYFECPYCFTICSTEILCDRAWKAHLIHDLRPYICTYEQCRNSDQLYDTRKDWIQHENSTHRRVWRCLEHESHISHTREEFRTHLHHQHSQISSHNSELEQTLIDAAQTSLATSERCCPICLAYIEGANELHKHIALHLERLALFALPRSTDDDDSESCQGDSDRANADTGGLSEDFDSSLDMDSQNEQIIASRDLAQRRWKKVLNKVRWDRVFRQNAKTLHQLPNHPDPPPQLRISRPSSDDESTGQEHVEDIDEIISRQSSIAREAPPRLKLEMDDGDIMARVQREMMQEREAAAADQRDR